MAKGKPDSDKDLLFSKILPALNDNPFSSSYKGDECNFDIEDLPSESEDTLSLLRNKLFARSNTFPTDSYATINIMENLVLQIINPVIERFNACSCDRCRCDVAAYALNHLIPRYIVAEQKTIERTQKDIGTRVVLDALVNAVIQIRANPRH